MLIDWFTVAAQALNFVILAWLMKRFLYQPILDAIDAREQRIKTELAAAADKQTEAQQARDDFQKKSDDFEQQRAALLKQAQLDADAERQKLMAAARRASEALTTQRQEALASEARTLLQALRQRTQTEVFTIARQALTDVAGASLEASACEHFIQRLRGLEGAPRQALAEALHAAGDKVFVRSAFELPAAQRRAIHKALADSYDIRLDLRFEVDPAGVAGIELVAQGRKFAWSLGEHLASLERGVSELLKAQAAAP
jgi:F-type H+-transporting ATPase subunit b